MTFQLESGSGVPIYRQIIDMVRCGVASGKLRPGDQLPTVRALAVELAVNPNTVIKAYTELEREGLVTSEQGSGTFITASAQDQLSSADRKVKLRTICREYLAQAQRLGFTAEEVRKMVEALGG